MNNTHDNNLLLALALGVLVAADVLDTVMKPAHAYEISDVVKVLLFL